MAALLELDRFRLAKSFDKEPFHIRHRVSEEPFFSIPSLVALARRLPERSVEYQAGDVPVGVDPRFLPPAGVSLEEALRNIEQSGSWVALKNVEQDPSYRDLMERCLREVELSSERSSGAIRDRQAFIFVSSPFAVTPYHIDPEHNFLLQLRGRKTVHIWDPSDRSVLSEEELERFHSGAHRNLVFREELRGKAARFDLGPGDGLYFPVTAPHWVENGPAVSVSLSLTFRTPESERREILHRINSRLRGWGLRPGAGSAAGDWIKYAGFRAARSAKRRVVELGFRK